MAGTRLLLIAGLLTTITSIGLAKKKEAPQSECATFQTARIFEEHKLQIQILLYTPHNPICGQLLSVNQSGGIESSMFNASLDTKMIIHGFRVLGNKPSWTEDLVEAFLSVGAANVLVIDWVTGATAKYYQAVDNVPKLSVELVSLIESFLKLGSTLESIHIIGVSLGAHVAGYIGNHFGGRIGRITGLDPAAYKFTRTRAEDRLDPGDAVFVEAIHTDTDNFGIRIPVGHVDYFINGGRDQPGCPSVRYLYRYLICDHMRSVHVYIHAIRGSCPFIGYPCSSYQEFQEGRCVTCENSMLSSCPQIGGESTLMMPETDIQLNNFNPDMENNTSVTYLEAAQPPKEISLFLFTTASEPYCAHHILLEFTLNQMKESSISLEIQLTATNSSTGKAKITIPKQSLVGRGVAALGTPLCNIHTVGIKLNSPLTGFWRKPTPFSGTLCMAELPLNQRLTLTGTARPPSEETLNSTSLTFLIRAASKCQGKKGGREKGWHHKVFQQLHKPASISLDTKSPTENKGLTRLKLLCRI